MLKVPSISAQADSSDVIPSSEAPRTSGRLDETSKKGLCWSELKRSGMSQWGVCRLVKFENKNDEPQMSSIVVKEDEDQRDEGEAVTAESPVIAEIRKRKCLTLSQLGEEKVTRCEKVRQQCSRLHKCKKNKLEKSNDRWSADRYKLAERNMLEIMKDEGAVFENPISRPALRTAARKRIGDTGLLDHLLKHIDGRVAPGGTERFRRCYNTEGVMEYWLESADLVKIKRESGMTDPNYIPPSWWKHGGGPSQESVCSDELKLLKAEMEKMKSDMHKMMSKQRELEQHNPIEMHKELVKWKAKTDQYLIEISSSLSGMQDMCKDLVKWKAKIEQQLVEISNSLSSLQSSKNCTTLSSSNPERWEDWLENTNLDDIQAEDFVPLLGNGDLVNVGGEMAVRDLYSAPPPQLKPRDSLSQDPVCSRELELLKEEMAKIYRDVQELGPRRQEEDQANVTPDSSLTTNSKPDHPDNSLLIFQQMLQELTRWKSKMEQQLMEISKTVSAMQDQSYRLP